MIDFNLNEYLAQLEASESINLCPKVPNPKLRANENYIFISYAHADYKQVYKAIAHMYASGVRFWYDSGLTAGVEWNDEVTAIIRSESCIGAVLFLSENLFLSKSVIGIELPCILGVDEKGNAIEGLEPLNHFSVNLTEKLPIEIIAEVMPDIVKRGLGTTWIRTLSTAFPDEVTYISAHGKGYIEQLIAQIRDSYGVIGKNEHTDKYRYEGGYENGKYHGRGKLYFPEDDGRISYEGEFVYGEIEGEGKMRYTNGDEYFGFFKNGKRHGYGKLCYANGNIYEGFFADGKPEGTGVLRSTNGTRYEGFFTNGKQNGKGVLRIANGDVVVGNWVDGSFQGHGKYTYSESSSIEYYDGEFLRGKRNGKGTMRWRNGDEYIGDWQYGLRHGNGKMVYANGDEYIGEWSNGELNGEGTMRYENGASYRGGFKNGRKHGKGKYIYHAQSPFDYFEGVYENGHMLNGVFCYKSGITYNGEFANGRFNGKGRLKYPTDRDEIYFIYDYEGDFKDDQFDGVGIERHIDGSVYVGGFKKGKFHGKGEITFMAFDEIEISSSRSYDYYSGDFENGEFNGHGIIHYSNAGAFFPEDFTSFLTYEGEFANGKRDGFGKMRYTNGDEYVGLWENDLPNGNGTMHWANVDAEGYWTDSHHGKVNYQFPYATRVECVWVEGQYNGSGTTYFSEESIYESVEGEFTLGMQLGNVVIRYRNGDIYTGYAMALKPYGNGKMVYADGKVLEGTWENGEFVE